MIKEAAGAVTGDAGKQTEGKAQSGRRGPPGRKGSSRSGPKPSRARPPGPRSLGTIKGARISSSTRTICRLSAQIVTLGHKSCRDERDKTINPLFGKDGE